MTEKDDAGRLTGLFSAATMLGEYRDALMAQGFTREEAMAFCRDFMTQSLKNSGGE